MPVDFCFATEHANQADPGGFVAVGAVQTAARRAWTVEPGVGRGGGLAAQSPLATPDSWLLAVGLDEPGLVVDSWWFLDETGGVDVGQGVRTTATGGVPSHDELGRTGTTWDLAAVVGDARAGFGPTVADTPTGTWRRVEVRVDQQGRLEATIDGSTRLPTTGTVPGSGAASGTFAFRSGTLPADEVWWIDDVRARRYVVPEPTTSLATLIETLP